MTYDKAIEIVDLYDYFSDLSCCCHMGNPPCSKCEYCPSKEDYNEAQVFIEEHEREENA